MKRNGKQYPYGFNLWVNQLWQVGQKMKMWNFTVMNYEQNICLDSWLVYFMMGLSPKEAIKEDLKEQP